jgi:hypothetical protein
MPRIRVLALLLTSALAAQLPRSPDALPADVRQTLIQRMGADPFAALAAWRRAPGDSDPPAWLPADGRGDAAWDWLVHTALWHQDHDVAYTAATLLSYPHLDLVAADRWLTVVWPHVFAASTAHDWEQVRRQVSSQQVADLLADRDCWRAEVRPFFLSDMHRCMRPEHAPLLAALANSDDPFLRRGAFANLGTVANYTDQHRSVIGDALLRLHTSDLDRAEEPFLRARNAPHQPRPYHLPTARPGWSPLLRAALERSFLELDKPLFAAFLMRWAEAESPASEDRLLLAALLAGGQREATWLAQRAMARMAPEPFLLRQLRSPPDAAPAGLLLAARHDWSALRELANKDTDALAVALEFDFDATFLAWSAVAFGADAAAGLAAVQRLVEVADAVMAPYRTQPLLVGRLRQAIDLFGDRLDFARLHVLVENLHAVRSERLIELYWAAVTPQNLAACDAAVFEVSASTQFHERLREWGAAADEAVRAPALDLLLRLGDAQLDQAVLGHWQAHHQGDPMLLARCRQSRLVSTFLRDALRKEALDSDGHPTAQCSELLAAVAMTDGMPHGVAEHWTADLGRDGNTRLVRERFGRWREQVLAGEWRAALLDHCSAQSPRALSVGSLGQVDDDAMRELLQKVRSTPGAVVQSAINELAIAGDPEALEELDELRARHIYGWFDDADNLVQTGGRSLDLVPWLLGELETNCCRRNSAASALQFLYGFEVHAISEEALQTQAARAREYWRAVGEHLKWSVLANRFVVAAH